MTVVASVEYTHDEVSDVGKVLGVLLNFDELLKMTCIIADEQVGFHFVHPHWAITALSSLAASALFSF